MTEEICTTEEQYATACRTSDLKVVADKGGAGDLMISAGWSPAQLGLALMRLQTKPGGAGLEYVHMQLSIRAAEWKVSTPDIAAASVLAWWLAKTCRFCAGRKFKLIAGTPGLSAKQCRVCKGSGEKALPFGQDGLRLAGYLDDCKNAGAASVRKRLRQWR